MPRGDVRCSSAYDRARNRHRDGLAWSKTAVRTILLNPRYTGHQVWNKQRTDEVLLDVNDVALGHTPVMRWNQRDRWVTSNELVHEPLIQQADFDRVQDMLGRRARTATAPKRAHRSRHPYIFKSLSTAASAAGRCKASTPTASPTTAAASRRSMPWPTRSTTRAT
ncbi:hypothetical protein DLE60_25320 [Micromonospora globispora]|uniref:recombinase family protein n=1 Tax=Micromonospora globispora TaxID=1450148 RepID=UPI000D6F2F2D|nr:hypothetical protein DLE60_25320 [Micromonospora globispora]